MAQHRESPVRRVNPSSEVVWKARYTDAAGRRRSAGTFRLKRQAQNAIDAAYGQPTVASTVSIYLEHWLRARPRSARTDQTNEGRIRAVLAVEIEGRALAEWDMRALKRRHRDEMIALMLVAQGRSPGGARNVLRALSAMFEDAITDELCDTNPWRGAKVRDDDRRAQRRARMPRVWSFDQMHDFAAAAGRDEAAIRVLADCGLRIGELFALRREDMRDGIVTIRGSAWEGRIVESSQRKNHDREIPVPPSCLALVREVPVRIDSPWLFPSPAGKLWRYSNWHRRIWQPICQVVGIDPTPHEFRHSWVTHLRAAGLDPADLADIAGHSVQTATSRYTHPLRRSFDHVRELVG